MPHQHTNEKSLEKLIEESVKKTFSDSGIVGSPQKPFSQEKKPTILERTKAGMSSLKEALIASPKGFLLKTERLSAKTKEAHEILYKAYVDAFNKASSQLDAVSREESNSTFSNYRNVSRDVTANLNSIKLHEMYFGNISDLNSEISLDAIPYIKISRDFGSFENWQYDFIAACMAAKNGWALTVYDTYKKAYMNIVVDDNMNGLPLGAIPIIVIDMWEHAYFKDYLNDKKSYIVAMMRELNWNVIEARITVAERSQLGDLWQIVPIVNGRPELMLSAAEAAEPVPVQAVPPEQQTQSQRPNLVPPPASPSGGMGGQPSGNSMPQVQPTQRRI